MSEARQTFVVTEADTAAAVGSGSLPVLGTPRLLAWCEAVTCSALESALGDGETSVGTRIELEHLVATPVGGSVEVTARIVHSDGRLRRFAVAARNLSAAGRPGKLAGSGEVTRVVVDAERFLARVTG
ncbi:hotdog domain-containing protein [Nocardioides sp. WS12]|uniref:thioesterase family protein n=1 Tax=Nocardioides sp. WS12 TaxID=2486272 RepID=UPI0015F8CDBC|nr:hotdog domain-containing protein [Nocardioides sp. WS12]